MTVTLKNNPYNKSFSDSKADIDLANTTPAQNLKEMSVGWGLPDFSRAINILSLPSYTCPCNGYLYLAVTAQGNGTLQQPASITYNTNLTDIELEPDMPNILYRVVSYAGSTQRNFWIVRKNEILTKSATDYYSARAYFIPMKGVQNA